MHDKVRERLKYFFLSTGSTKSFVVRQTRVSRRVLYYFLDDVYTIDNYYIAKIDLFLKEQGF